MCCFFSPCVCVSVVTHVIIISLTAQESKNSLMVFFLFFLGEDGRVCVGGGDGGRWRGWGGGWREVGVAGKWAGDSAGSWRRSDKATRTKEGSAVQAKGGGGEANQRALALTGIPAASCVLVHRCSDTLQSSTLVTEHWTNKETHVLIAECFLSQTLFIYLFLIYFSLFILCRIISLTGSI